MLPSFALARPTTVAETVGLLSEEKVPYCGGTELLLAMKLGLLRPDALIDLKRVEELREVVRRGEQISIGAGVNHLSLGSHPLIRDLLPLLAEVEGKVGNPRVRAQGSIGGNLCFAEPRSDVATALMALRATVTLVSSRGRREMSVDDFVQGPYWVDRRPDELLLHVKVPIERPNASVYLKFQTAERPTVGIALLQQASTPSYRLVVGAVGERPMAFDYTDLEQINPVNVASHVDPVPDSTGSEEYKRHVTAVYVRRAVAAFSSKQSREA